MLTGAITAALIGLLAALGVENAVAYTVPIGVAVKVAVVTPLVAGFMWWRRRRGLPAPASATESGHGERERGPSDPA